MNDAQSLKAGVWMIAAGVIAVTATAAIGTHWSANEALSQGVSERQSVQGPSVLPEPPWDDLRHVRTIKPDSPPPLPKETDEQSQDDAVQPKPPTKMIVYGEDGQLLEQRFSVGDRVKLTLRPDLGTALVTKVFKDGYEIEYFDPDNVNSIGFLGCKKEKVPSRHVEAIPSKSYR